MRGKKHLVFLWLFILSVPAVDAQHCNPDTLMTIVSKWKKIPDANMEADKNRTQIISRIDRISRMFLSTHPEPRGTDARWYRTMNPYPLVPGGPRAYNFQSSLRLFYCNKNVDQVAIDERANAGMVHINSLTGFLWDQQDMIKTKVEGNDVYLLPNPIGEWKGHPVYGFNDETGGMRSLLLMHKTKLPWKPVTKLQYLNALKMDWEDRKKKMAAQFDQQISSLRQSIKEYQDNKDLPQSSKDEIIASLKKGIAEWESKRVPEVAKSDAYWNDRIAVIDVYMKVHKNELAEPAVVDRTGGQVDDFEGSFSAISKGGQLLVMMNPNYFDRSLPSYIPQLMVFTWSWFNEPAGWYFKKNVEEKFPIEELEGMMWK